MHCPNIVCGILKSNATLDTLNSALKADKIIVLIDNAHNAYNITN